MKVFIPDCTLAWDEKTKGLPVYIIDQEGNILGHFEAQEDPLTVELPEETWRLLWFYRSRFPGSREVFLFRPENGLPKDASVHYGNFPEEIRAIIPGEAGKMTIRFLHPEWEGPNPLLDYEMIG